MNSKCPHCSSDLKVTYELYKDGRANTWKKTNYECKSCKFYGSHSTVVHKITKPFKRKVK